MKHSKLIGKVVVLAFCVFAVFCGLKIRDKIRLQKEVVLSVSVHPYGLMDNKETYLVATQVFFPKAVNMSQASFTVGDFSKLGEVNETLSKDKTLTEDYYKSKVLLEKNTRVMIDYKIVQMDRPMDIENLTVKATIKYRGVKIQVKSGKKKCLLLARLIQSMGQCH